MDTKIIGRQIANGRKDCCLSQVALAEMLYVTPQAVSKWERSEALPDIYMLAKISDIFGVYDINYFLDDEACPCNKLKGEIMNNDCNDCKTIEDFVEFWESCSLKGLQKIALKYDVDFEEKDTKEVLIKKLKKGMEECCK